MFNEHIYEQKTVTMSELPIEIVGNIITYLSINEVMAFMQTSKENYNKTKYVLQTPEHYNLDKNTKHNTTITNDDIDEINGQPKNSKLDFLSYLFIDIKSIDELIFLEKYISLIKCNISFNIKSIDNFSVTPLLNNINSIIFKKVSFRPDFKFTNNNIKYLEFSNCNVTNEMISDIKYIGTLYIEKSETFTTFNNNIKCNNIVISRCKNFTHFGNINCNIIEVQNIDNVDFSTLIKNKSTIGKLQIVNCDFMTINMLNINNMSIINCNVDSITDIHYIERLKLLNCSINSISNISNINNLIIDNCLSNNNIVISNIENVGHFSMKYVIRDPADIVFTPNYKFKKLKKINHCEMDRVKISEFEIDTCDNLSIKTYFDIINSENMNITNINNKNITILNMY